MKKIFIILLLVVAESYASKPTYKHVIFQKSDDDYQLLKKEPAYQQDPRHIYYVLMSTIQLAVTNNTFSRDEKLLISLLTSKHIADELNIRKEYDDFIAYNNIRINL